jgi:hypothetical protein
MTINNKKNNIKTYALNSYLLMNEAFYHCVVILLAHRVDRVLSFFSSRPNWTPPPPHRRRAHTRLREREWYGLDSNEGQTLWYICMQFLFLCLSLFLNITDTTLYIMGGGGGRGDRCASTLHSAHPQKTTQEDILGFFSL